MAGTPVAGVRVRFRALTGHLPDLPSDLVSVISCGLNSVLSEEYYDDSAQMDGASDRDHAEPCITGDSSK